MTADEMEIIEFLKLNPESFFARKEIARKAKRREEYEENPHWTAAPLSSLVTLGYVVQNESGHYKLCDDYESRRP
jgi:hypothetical protein